MTTQPGRDAETGTDEAMSGFVRDAIRDMVELQLRENMPPEIGLNVERLVAAGFLREEALSLVGCALSREMSDALDSGKPFDAPRYLERVALLPAAPWDDDRPLSADSPLSPNPSPARGEGSQSPSPLAGECRGVDIGAGLHPSPLAGEGQGERGNERGNERGKK